MGMNTPPNSIMFNIPHHPRFTTYEMIDWITNTLSPRQVFEVRDRFGRITGYDVLMRINLEE